MFDQAGGETHLVVADAGHGCDRHRDEHEWHAEADHEEAGEQVGQVEAVDRDLCEQEQADAQQRHPDEQHRLDADAVDEHGRDVRPDDRRARHGQVAEPGLERRHVQHQLHVQREQQEHREQHRAQDEPGHVRTEHGSNPEDRERDERLVAAALPGEERSEQRGRDGERRPRGQRAPAPLVGLGDPEHEHDQRRSDQHGAEYVERLRPQVAALHHPHRREDQRDDPDGNVDEEDPLPASEGR